MSMNARLNRLEADITAADEGNRSSCPTNLLRGQIAAVTARLQRRFPNGTATKKLMELTCRLRKKYGPNQSTDH